MTVWLKDLTFGGVNFKTLTDELSGVTASSLWSPKFLKDWLGEMEHTVARPRLFGLDVIAEKCTSLDMVMPLCISQSVKGKWMKLPVSYLQ